jgi:hypothetical protein
MMQTNMIRSHCLLMLIGLAAVFAPAQPIKVLIVDGQNNHQWKETTPVLKEILQQAGVFQVEVATAPPKGSDMSGFRPNFSAYQVVLSNYTGDPWPAETNTAFERFVKQGRFNVITRHNAFWTGLPTTMIAWADGRDDREGHRACTGRKAS